MMKNPAPGALYIPQLTFPRFVAAVMVVIFHYGQQSSPFNTSALSGLISQGSIAVSFFFFLSGMVLMLNYGPVRTTPGSFWLKRFARIYPLYLFAFLLIVISEVLTRGAGAKGISILLQAIGLHAWVPGICLEMNFPGWSISVEMFFYLLFPFLLPLFRKMKFKTAGIVVLIIWGLSAIQHIMTGHFVNLGSDKLNGEFNLYFPLWHLNTFLFGMLAGIAALSFRLKPGRTLVPLLGFLAGLVTFIYILVSDNGIKPHIHNGLLAPVFFLICVGLAFDRSLITRWMSHKIPVFLGDISYSVYLLQYPVYFWLTYALGRENLHGPVFWIYLLILMSVSALTFLLLERPARKWLVKRFMPKTRARVNQRGSLFR